MPDPSILNLKGEIGNSTELDAIANPSLQRLGMFVRDIDATTKELSSIWGIDSWESLEFAPPPKCHEGRKRIQDKDGQRQSIRATVSYLCTGR